MWRRRYLEEKQVCQPHQRGRALLPLSAFLPKHLQITLFRRRGASQRALAGSEWLGKGGKAAVGQTTRTLEMMSERLLVTRGRGVHAHPCPALHGNTTSMGQRSLIAKSSDLVISRGGGPTIPSRCLIRSWAQSSRCDLLLFLAWILRSCAGQSSDSFQEPMRRQRGRR